MCQCHLPTSMGRMPCCEKIGLNRGKWTSEEDQKLINYIKANGDGLWRSLPKNAGLLRCGKSCRLRWVNYLRDDVKRGNFTNDEEETIVKLHTSLGNKWSLIASHLPGRTDNEIKNYWNSHLRREIYRFRSINQSTHNSADAIKMVKTSKRRTGRVSRAVAKKYNKNANPHLTTKTKCPEKISTNELNMETAIKEADCLEGASFVPESSQDPGSFNSCDLFDTLRQWEEATGDVFMHLKEFEQAMEIDSGKEPVMSEETDKVLMSMECVAGNEDTNSVAWSSHMEAGNLFGCSSPVSYFNNDRYSWDLDGAMNELHFWNEEDMSIWS